MSNKFRSFSKRLTKRIIIVLTLTLAVIFAGLYYLATSLTRDMNRSMFYCIMDTESEIVEKELYGVQLSTQSSIRHMQQAVTSPGGVYDALEYEPSCQISILRSSPARLLPTGRKNPQISPPIPSTLR